MNPEKINENPIIKADLGENIFENKIENNAQIQSVDEEGYFGKPEKYDYSLVELPENYFYDETLLNEFNDLAGKYNLSQKSANELMSMAVKLTKLMGDSYSKNLAEQNRQKVNDYKQLLKTDEEIGGANLEKTMYTANQAYSKLADENLQQLLAETGLNCHPSIIKMFYNLGKKMQNDSVYGLNSGAVVKENREDILFPTM